MPPSPLPRRRSQHARAIVASVRSRPQCRRSVGRWPDGRSGASRQAKRVLERISRRLNMATTAEPHRQPLRNHRRADAREGLGHRRARPAATPDGVRTSRTATERRLRSRSPRRNLPQRPAHLPQRLGREAAIRSSRATESFGTVAGGRRRSHAPPRRRHGCGRLHGRQLHGVRPVPRRLGSLLPQGLRPDLQQRRLSRRHDHQGRLHRPYRRPRPFRCKVPEGMDVAASRLCSAPASRPTRRCVSTMSARIRRSPSSASADLATSA